MEIISVVAATLTALEVAYEIAVTTRFIFPAWEVLTLQRLRRNYGSLNQKFGMLQALVLIAIFPDAKQIVDRVERHILGAKTEEALLLRKSTSEDCTMLAVAVCSEMLPSKG
jgi:hypothetical protein